MQNKGVDITAYKAIDHLNELAWSMNREDSHESIELANKALEDSEKCEYVFGIACAKKTLSACYVWNSRNDESANLCFQAIALFQNLKDKQNEADVNYILGSNFFYLSDYDTSLKYYQNCLQLSTEINYKFGIADGLNGVGTVLYTIDQNEEALISLTKSKVICEKYNLNGILIRVLDGLGETHINLKEYDVAIKYYTECIKIIDELTGNLRVRAFALDGLGRAYTGKNDYEKALAKFNESLIIRKKIDFKFGVATTLKNIGILYIKKTDYQSAIINLKEVYDICNKINNKEGVFQASEKLAELFEFINNPAEALRFYKIFHSTKEDVRNFRTVQLLKSLDLQSKVIKSQSDKIILEEKAKELQNFSESLILMSEIGQKIISSLSVATIVNTVYKNVNELMDATGFGIGIFKEEENAIIYPLVIEAEERFENLKFNLEETNRLTAICFNESREIIINDFDKDISNFIKENTEPKAGKFGVSAMYLPLFYKDSVLGVMTVQSFKKNAYSNYHINIFKNLATYTAIAIENAKMYEEQEFKIIERTKELTISKEQIERTYVNNKKLSEIGKEITSNLNLGKIFKKLHLSINEIMEADCFGVRIYKPELNAIEYKYEIERNILSDKNEIIPLTDDNNYTVWCLKNKTDIFLNDNEKEFKKYVNEIRVVSGDMPSSLLFTPIMIGEKILGVITVQSFRKYAYKEYHIDMLRTLATYTAIALENAYLYENLEETVLERTKEVIKQKEEINIKNVELIANSNQIRKSLKEKEVLLKEIHHRVKNNLQIISSLLGLQSNKIKADDLKLLFSESRSKISAIAQVHEKLYQSDNLSEVNIDDYLTSLYSSIISILEVKANNIEFIYKKSDLYFDIDTSVPLGLILNELVTNSIKYAFNGYEHCAISVSLEVRADKMYEFSYSDNGSGFDTKTTIEGLGLNLIKLLARQLGGVVEIDATKGTKFRIAFMDTSMRKTIN